MEDQFKVSRSQPSDWYNNTNPMYSVIDTELKLCNQVARNMFLRMNRRKHWDSYPIPINKNCNSIPVIQEQPLYYIERPIIKFQQGNKV